MPAGEIARILYWYPGLGQWVDLLTEGAPQVLLNTELSLTCGWLNRGTGRAAGHVDAIITKPDGTQETLLAVAYQDQVAPRDSGWNVEFLAIVLDQLGNYQGEFILKMMDEVAGVTAAVGWATIWPYVIIAYYWDGVGWIQVLYETILVDGTEYSIQVTQDCVLNYNGYYFQLYAGWNTIIWQTGGAPGPGPTPPAGVTFTLVGYNYPAWVTEEEILVWDGEFQMSGLQAPGTSFTISIPSDSTNAQFNLFGPQYPGGVGTGFIVSGITDGMTVQIDVSALLPSPYNI